MKRPFSATECERFVNDMLAHMTPLEKAGQLAFRAAPDPADQDAVESFARALRAGRIGGVRGISSREQSDAWQQLVQEETRLGIPLLFTRDIQSGFDTIFPTPATMCASFDPAALESAGKVIAQEAESHGVNWAFGPKVRLGGSPGEDSETFHAEQAELTAMLCSALIRGLQDEGGAGHLQALACLDLTSVPGGADRSFVDEALAMAKEAILAADVGSVAFHRTDEDTRRALDRAFARIARPGGYDGIVLAEWDALAHDATETENGGQFDTIPVDSLVEAVASGRISAVRLDDAVARVLRAKFRLGLFSKELSGNRTRPGSGLPTPVHNREVALNLARRSAILLRNEPALLPLDIDSGDILVVGSAASDRHLALAGRKGIAASVIDGLEQLGIPHRYVPGLALRSNGTPQDRMIDADRMAIGMASEAAKRAGTLIVVLPTDSKGVLGEAQHQLLTSLRGANPRIVLVTIGAQAVDPDIAGEPLSCILHAGEPGSMGGHAIAELIAGDASPSAKLPYALPAAGDQTALPFGHGETYADFALTGVAIQLGHNRIVVSGELRNVGDRDSTETVQLYANRRIEGASGETMKKLIRFTRHHLRPGQRETLLYSIDREDIGIEDESGRYQVFAGQYDVFIGTSSARGVSETVSLSEEIADAMARGEQGGGSHPMAGGRRSA